jgi:chloramphenicol 3-O phosphotransferase
MGGRLISTMHQCIYPANRSGMNILADHVLLEKSWVKECADLFSSLNAYPIGMRCPLEILVMPGRSRKNRTLGQAKAQYISAHEHCLYDLEVDTSLWKPEEGAKKILDFIQQEKPGPSKH